MAKEQNWQRDPNGFRFDFGGINTVLPSDTLPANKYPYAQNVRRYLQNRVKGRATQGAAILSLPNNPVHSVRRLNDSTPAGPLSGFILISGAGGALFAGATLVDGGMSGKPISLVPFRPNASVQPWMYVADVNKMLKVRSDGTTYKDGVKEPQVAPGVTPNVASTVISTIGDVTVYIWGDSPHSGPVGQYIWRNPTDTGSSGISRSIGNENVNTTGNSLLFDASPYGINSNPMQWSILDSTGAVTGTKSLFEPALESQGYQDFNFVAVASLYVPAPGTYTFNAAYKDRIQWGIGTGPNNAAPTWAGKGTILGSQNQTMTVVNKYPLLPAPASNDGGGYTGTSNVAVTFSAAGIYGIEINYDYWYHSNRHCTITVNSANIPPIPTTVFQNAQYRYTYRASSTGATSNPSPPSIAITLPAASTELVATPSTDPQVDKIDWYRMDSGLLDFTYVGTSINGDPTPFTDSLLDTDAAANPILQRDNYEPFPSIDLPRKGVVNVATGTVGGTMQVTWVSGDQFNVRWLPGTVIIIGTVAYTFYNRPTSVTGLTVTLPGDLPTTLTNLPYEIAEPILAAQPMPSMWGATDNVGFMGACGDPLRPGTWYWTKGNNPDSAPDTNQEDITSPSEPLMNGCIVGGIQLIFSTERAWLAYPNFFNALATVSGTVGSTWTLQESIADRGLYIRGCLCTDGGKSAFFRAKDGIYISPGGVGSKSITDDIYNLFPHEGQKPTPITRGGYTLYPPDDTQPDNQCLRFSPGYVYYDYLDVNGVPRTLVHDVEAGGWVPDVYGTPVTTHSQEEGPDANDVATGCNDGTVRILSDTGTEVATCVLATQAVNAGDARANKRVGDIFVRGSVASTVTLAAYMTQYGTALGGFSPSTLAVGPPNTGYIIDFTSGLSQEVDDIEVAFSWAAGNATILDLWQPNFIPLPEGTQDRPTDWTDCGSAGAKFVQGLILECDTFNAAKALTVENADDGSFHTPNESPITVNGQQKIALTFTPPFVAHLVRIVTTDGVKWRIWDVQWITEPFPESVVQWQSEFTSHGLQGWQHLRELNIAHISTADLTLTIVPDVGSVMVLTVPNSGGVHTKTKVTVPANKFKIVNYRISSTAPFRNFAQDMECKVGPWGRTDSYSIVRPFGGDSRLGAKV